MDKAVYEFTDLIASYLQKHHGLNLLQYFAYSRLAAAFFFTVFCLFSSLMRESPGMTWAFIAFNGFFVCASLMMDVRQYQRYGDYPEVQAHCDLLNLVSLWERERFKVWRLMWLGMDIILVPLFLFQPSFADLCWVAFAVIATVHQYMDCAFFLGPGEHSKEKNKKAAGAALPETTGAG